MTGPEILFIIPIFGGIAFTQTALSSFVVTAIICIASVLLGRNLNRRNPSKRQVFVEKMVSVLYNFVEETMGKHNSHWTPYIGALFLSSMLGSYIGMTGFLRPTTSDLSTTITWALMTSVLVWRCTIRTSGLGSFLKNYINPMNIISDVAQPVSMAFRHFGNIMGGSVLMSLVYTLFSSISAMILDNASTSPILSGIILAAGIALMVFSVLKKKKLVLKIIAAVLIVTGALALLQSLQIVAGIPFLQVGVPAFLSLYFDVFSGLVQALVFSLLTMVYVGSACEEPE